MKHTILGLAATALAPGASTAHASAHGDTAATADQGSTPAQASASVTAAALKAAASDETVRTVYAKLGWHPIWSQSAADALATVMDTRRNNALERLDLGAVDGSGSAAAQDVAKTKAAVRYAAALAHGAVDPAKLHEVYTIPRPDTDVAAGLANALQAGKLVEWFAGLAPQDNDYRALSKAYVDYAGSGEQDDTIEDGSSIHVGDTDPRVPDISAQLAANGYLPNGAGDGADGGGGSSYTQAIADGVKHLQTDYGIKDDGIVGPDTLAVLNTGATEKARALAVAMERRRWLTRTPPATRIDVNTAAATLSYYRDGKLVDQRKVIVGQPGRETPALRAPIYRLVANPTWTVPKSIPVSDATVHAKDMHRVNGYWVQPSGPDNALGLVKFDMQDDQAIYLHDTSDASLFDRTQRHLSHGCVRVDDALGFAQMIAESQGIADKWQQAHQSGDQTFIDLPQRIPVRLLYWNAFVDGDGQVAFRTDPYAWNGDVAGALGFADKPSKTAQAENIDVGP